MKISKIITTTYFTTKRGVHNMYEAGQNKLPN